MNNTQNKYAKLKRVSIWNRYP